MVDSWRSMMPATEAAMVSALAPGRVAVTAMVGKSTRGSAETGSRRKPNTPNAMIDAVISVGHDRPADAEFGERHRLTPRPCWARGSTRDPSDSSNCPSTTTLSSPDSPSAITDMPWKVRSTLTG